MDILCHFKASISFVCSRNITTQDIFPPSGGEEKAKFLPLCVHYVSQYGRMNTAINKSVSTRVSSVNRHETFQTCSLNPDEGNVLTY